MDRPHPARPAERRMARVRRSHLLANLSSMVCACLLTGCTWISYLGTDPTGSELGRTYYLGGAGPLGHVGTVDVPKGLRQAGYRGAVEVFGWQSIVGGTLRDQMDRKRNETQAHRLARRIEAYLRRYPGRPVNLVALSAGTGIAAWAVEALPEDLRINTVVFLSSSFSRQYDLLPVLQRIDNRLYNFFGPDDPVLRYAVPLAGSIDRQTRGPGLAGLLGFDLPQGADQAAAELYARRLRNMPYRKRYRDCGYRGMHTDATSAEFVAQVIAPLLMEPLCPPVPFDQRGLVPGSQPAAHTQPAGAWALDSASAQHEAER